jgi:hypothetical protein
MRLDEANGGLLLSRARACIPRQPSAKKTEMIVAVSKQVSNGKAIDLATLEDDLLIATSDDDDLDELGETGDLDAFCCSDCFIDQHPEGAFILQACREKGWWRAGETTAQ